MSKSLIQGLHTKDFNAKIEGMSYAPSPLKPQDVLVLHCLIQTPNLLQKDISSKTQLSTSEISQSFKRLAHSKLLLSPNRLSHQVCLEFLVHVVKFLCPPILGGEAAGLRTAHSFKGFKIAKSNQSVDLVWPYRNGDTKGVSLYPIHPNVPGYVANHKKHHRFFALLDLIRVGKSRERGIAIKELTNLLESSAKKNHPYIKD